MLIIHQEFKQCIKKTNPIYYKLIHKFKELTGCPILVNTSFNIRGEPIVCSVEDILVLWDKFRYISYR